MRSAELANRLAEWTGLDFARGGQIKALERFLAGRVRALGLPSVEAYAGQLTGPQHPEAARLINAVTVNHSWFYRDPEQMQVIAQLMHDGAPGGGPLNVWVPGCATGEDAYTVAMLAHATRQPVRVLASDIDSEVLEHARVARYSAWAVSQLPPELQGLLGRGSDGRVEVPASVRSQVRCLQHNLMDPPPSPEVGSGWHLIVCRNVLIYFRQAEARATIQRLGQALVPGGWLFLGSSEVVHAPPPGLCLTHLGRRFALRRAAPAAPRVAATPWPATVPPGVPRPVPSPPAPPAGDVEQLAAADAHFKAGRFAEAIRAYTEALGRDPLCIPAHLLAGIALYLSGDPAAAARALRGVLFLDGDLWPAAFYLASSYEMLGQFEEARREYRRVVECCESPLVLDGAGAMAADLETWKPEIVSLARQRLGRSHATA
ncbi:MAG: tetratricopeptide repeat protein [Deltaproteobacteria bacterium]|nr:tetratricopeptide repeat protein [Deltaproteobacteria bacterium]